MASAHDMWLDPVTPVMPASAPLTIDLLVGEALVAHETRAFESARVVHANDVSASVTVDLLALGREKRRPFLRATLSTGGHLVAVERAPARIELAAAKFESYLREEGLDEVIAARAARGEAQRAGRERYARFLKAFVQVGAAHDAAFAKVVGHSLELVLEDDPTLTRVVHLRLLDRGAPLASTTVEFFHREGGTVHHAAVRTGADGRFEVTVAPDGLNLLTLVRMERCEGCADVEWESRWTALTFPSLPTRPTLTSHRPAASPHKSRRPLYPVAIGSVVTLVILFFLFGRPAEE